MPLEHHDDDLVATPTAASSAPPPPLPQAPPQSLICGLCRNGITVKANSIRTICNHNFHKSCFTRSSNGGNCPSCGTKVEMPKNPVPKPIVASSIVTRQQLRKNTFDENRTADNSTTLDGQSVLNETNLSETPSRSSEDDRRMIRNLVTAAVGAQQAQMLSSLNQTLAQLVETSIEAGFRKLSLLNSENSPEPVRNIRSRRNVDSEQSIPIENQTMNQLLGIRSPSANNHAGNLHNTQGNDSSTNLRGIYSGLSDLSMRPDKVSQIISNWKLKYSGSSDKLSVDAFLYRVEALTNQTLGGNLDLLCDNASTLFEGKANTWFWRYHQSVGEIRLNYALLYAINIEIPELTWTIGR